MALSKDERLAAARARTQHNVDSKDSYGVSGKRILDLEKVGGYKKEMFYRPKAGMNHIDFVPYVVKSDRHPDRLKVGTPDYALTLFVHRSVGAAKDNFICLNSQYGKPCPICEAREALKLDPDATKEEIAALYPKKRCWYNVIDLDSKDKNQPVQIFEESHFLFEKELLEFITAKNAFEFWDIEFGKTLEFMAAEHKSDKGNHFKYKQFYLDDRQPYGEEIYDEAYNLVDLLYIPTYEEVRNSYLGVDDSEAPVVDERPARSRGIAEERPARTRGEEAPVAEAPARSRGRNIGEEIAEETKDMYKEPEAPARSRERTRPAPAEAENRCPLGHTFGKDNNVDHVCSKCDEKLWNECGDEYDRLKAAE